MYYPTLLARRVGGEAETNLALFRHTAVGCKTPTTVDGKAGNMCCEKNAFLFLFFCVITSVCISIGLIGLVLMKLIGMDMYDNQINMTMRRRIIQSCLSWSS